ncbi:MAG: glycerophosphodiester phosphodiesterase, partial [Vicinamibacterales bacterium]
MRVKLAKFVAVTLAVATVVAWLWAAVLRGLFQRYTSGERPGQFRGWLDADLLDDYGPVFVIAHNAGDNAETARTALEQRADAVEIDVIMVVGRLYAAHATPPKLIDAWFFRGPKLEDAWEVVCDSDAVALDLKDSSPGYVNALVRFLDDRPHPQVLLSSRDIDSLIELGERLPNAHLYLSMPDRETFERLATDEGRALLLDGVSMRHSHIDEAVVGWLKTRRLRLIAWTVNDLTTVNRLVRMGVDGVTTDNLAIIELLGGRQREEPLLRRDEGWG